MTTAGQYVRFAAQEARGVSPVYERLSLAVAGDAELLARLAALPQPLALLEVGTSAGLCLYPDRYAYRYGDHRLGTGEPVLECAATGLTPPERLPEVVWRAGLDLNPLDVTDPADVAWLDALIWPEHAHRRARLRAAAA
jgi:hypothetical protein